MKKFLTMIIAAASVVRAAPPSDTCKQETWITNGTVNAIVAAGDKVYIGGSFTQVGPYTGDGVPIDASGAAVAVFPKIKGTVNAVCSDGKGGWFVGGAFSSVGGVARNNIAHILSNGSVDPAWDPNAYNSVYSLAVSGTTVYVGGDFTTIGGQSRNRIAALDATTGLAAAWAPNADSVVYSIALSGATVYAGGRFDTIGGQARNRLAALDATTGNVLAWDPNADSVINSLAVSGATVYAGGAFTGIGGQSRNYIAALDATTGLATAWNPNANKSVRCLALSGTTVYAGGDFTTIGVQGRNYIAALDSTTGLATAWNPDANNSVRCLALSGTTVYAGGDFTTIGGQGRNYIAALDSTTGLAAVWNPNTNNSVRCLAVSGTTVYAGGWFTSIGGQGRNYIAALDATTGNVNATWNPNANDYVYSLAANGTTVYAGGFFTGIGGQVRNHIAALDATTGLAADWNPNADSVVYSLAASGTTVYAGGRFIGIGDSSRIRIAALDASTGKATAWKPDADSAVFSLAVSGATVYVGGRFAVIGGQARNRLAALDATTGNVLAWDPNADSLVYSLAVSGTTVYAGGRFTKIGGQGRGYIAALDATTGGVNATWNPNANDLVRCLAVSGTTVYAGGQFTTIGDSSRAYIAALDMTTGKASAWNPNAKDYVLSLAMSGATVYVGGQFNSIGRGIGHSFFAQFGNYYPAPVVSSITPSSGVNNAAVQITDVGGSNFRSGATVKLVKAGQSDINATGVSVVSSTQITCTIDITNAAPGAWDVVVANEDSKSATLSHGFTIASRPPVLVSPANNATDISLTPTLTWRKAADDSLYTVQLSASSDFSSPLVNDNRVPDSSLSLTTALPANNTAYHWKVAITKKGGEITGFSAPWTFTTVVAAPGAPVLLLPANTAQNQAVSPTLSWNSMPTAASYRVQVSIDPSFSTTVFDGEGITDIAQSLSGLANNTLYYWHVAAVNAGGVTWSAQWSFTTIVAIPGVPNCLSPSTGAENVAVNVPLVWSKITGAISYRIQIATDTGFASIVKDNAGISDTSLTWAGYANATHYYWRANSTNAGGSSQWSGRSEFTTIVALPSAITLLSPAINDTVKIDSVFLKWFAGTPQVDRFWVEYGSDSSFTNPTIDSAAVDTVKIVRDLKSRNNSDIWWRVKAHNVAGWGGWSVKRVFAVKIQLTHIRPFELPKAFSFAVSGRTGSIRYALPKAAHVFLRLYSINGQVQLEPVNTYQNAGYYTVNMQNGVFAAGSYLVIFRAGDYYQKRLMSLMK